MENRLGQPFGWMPNLDVTGRPNLHHCRRPRARTATSTTRRSAAAPCSDADASKLSNGDLAKFGTDQLGNDIYYGLGLRLTKYFGLDVVEHDGRDAGYRSHFIRFPDQHFAVACLYNLAPPDENLLSQLVRVVANVYLSDAFVVAPILRSMGPVARSPVVDTPADLAEYRAVLQRRDRHHLQHRTAGIVTCDHAAQIPGYPAGPDVGVTR